MAEPVGIFVESDPRHETKGDWRVRVGGTRSDARGGKFVSSHRLKRKAVERGRREGRKRSDRSGGAVLYVQGRGEGFRGGRFRREATYDDTGEGGGSGGGFFGNLFG